MPQTILVLNSSPQKNGNVSILCDYFIEGAKKSDNEVFRFDVAMMKIHGCMACFKGGKDINKPCVMHDDMDKIYPIFNKSELLF